MKPDDAFPLYAAAEDGFVPSWNWAAFFLGPLWYLAKGAWVKGLVLVVVVLFSHGMGLPLVLIYAGLFGNWDLYLARRRGTQLWTPGWLRSVISAATGRTRRCPHCAELIQPGAGVCRYCGRDVPPLGGASAATRPREG